MGFTRPDRSKPTIAAISGWCLAGGLELALWCDLRIATETARLGFTERRFGVPLIDGGTQRLPLVVGMGRALEMILTGRVVEAEEALSLGPRERGGPRGRPPRARPRGRRGPRRLPADDDALRPPCGDRGLGSATCRRAGARGGARPRLDRDRPSRRGALRRRRGPRRRGRRRLAARLRSPWGSRNSLSSRFSVSPSIVATTSRWPLRAGCREASSPAGRRPGRSRPSCSS